MNTGQLLITVGSASCTFLAAFLGTLICSDLLDGLLERRYRPQLERCLQLRTSERRCRELLRWWSLLLVGGFLLLAFVARAWPLAVTWLFLGSGLPVLTMQAVVLRRERVLEDQLVTVARSLANAVRAGLSIPQGLAGILAEVSQPLQGVLGEVVYQYERGRPLRDALAECRRRLQLEPFTLFCLALEVSLERGGRVNRSLEQLAGSLQEWQRIRRKLESETASGRFAVLLLSGCPLLFGLMFWCCGIEEVLRFFTEFGGQIVLSMVLLLIWSGNRWTSRIMNFSLS